MKRFKSFRMSETTFNQINSLPEGMRLKYYTAVCQYGIYGTDPGFEGVEYSVWLPMKDLIDFSNYRCKTSVTNGKNGGRPPILKESDETKNSLSDYSEIINGVKNAGYYIDEIVAKKFSGCRLPSEWMIGTHTFFEFTAERIAEKYGGKQYGERKALFIAAVMSWDDLRYEYPGWKERRDGIDRKANARKSYPTKCKDCGAELREFLGSYRCMKCCAQYDFDEKLLEWRKS